MAQEHLLRVPSWLPTEVQAWQVSADAQRILTLPAERKEAPLELWDAVKGQRIAKLLDPVYHLSAHLLPDGKVAALAESISDSGVSSQSAWVWDSQGKVLVRQSDLGGDFAEQEMLLSKDTLVLYHWQNCESGDANGRQLWSEGQVQSWHWPSRKLKPIARVQARLRQVALSPDGRWLITLGGDDMLGVWRPDTGQLVAKRYRTDRFQSLPGRLLVDGLILGLPQLQKRIPWNGSEIVGAGGRVYQFQGSRVDQLDPKSLTRQQTMVVQGSAGFDLSESLVVGKLKDGRVVLWDPSHRAVAVTANRDISAPASRSR
jgi:hypothetical protein